MLGILCEKPSAAKNFAKALGGMTGSYDGVQYKIVNSYGHVYEWKQPEDQVDASVKDRYSDWNIANLPWDEKQFKWIRQPSKLDFAALKSKKYVVDKGFYTALKNDLLSCDEIAIATDVDPSGEGELLAWEILDELGLHPKKWSRFYFTDEAPASIQKAFKTRKEIKSMQTDPDYLKALYRSKFDYLTMQFTRIAKKCTGLALRQGRLKSAMVVIVGDQLKAISEYKKIPFYTAKFKDENDIVYTDKDQPQFKTKGEVPIQQFTQSNVIVDKVEHKTQAPPKLIDLATLSANLAGKGIKAKDVLAVYQKMYEAQIVSYPRTEDKVITPEQFDELLPKIDKIASVVGVDSKFLTHRKPRPTHVKTGGAHGANRPGPNVPNSLSELSQYGSCAAAIYEILARNYLAMLCEDCQYDRETGHIEKYPTFVGSVNTITSKGFKAIYDTGDDDDEFGTKHLGKIGTPYVHEGFPPKPAQPTMKWLMKQLEKRDVGTGATRTSTYADVTNENTKSVPLLKDTKGKITFTDGGEMSYKILPNTHIGSIEVSEELFANMRLIAEGKGRAEDFLPRVAEMVRDDIATMIKNAESHNLTAGVDKFTGIYQPTGATISFKPVWSGYEFTADECQKLLNGEEISFTAKSAKTGNDFPARGSLALQTYKGTKFWGFKLADDNFAQNNDIPTEWCKHVFSQQEKNDLKAGKTIAILNAVSPRTGNPFSCTLTAKKQKNGSYKLEAQFANKK